MRYVEITPEAFNAREALGDFHIVSKNTPSKNKIYYIDINSAFDIETSRISEIDQSFMFLWQFMIGEKVILGRYWPEFKECISKLEEVIPDKTRLIVWVHNLSYEYQFLSGIFDFSSEDVFAVKSRKVLRCILHGKIEFRCTYLQTHLSLGALTKKMNVEHQKLDGDDFDYSKVRYPWTELSSEERLYAIHDVVGLCEAMEKRMKSEHDNYATIPLTSTGYVRREAKRLLYSTRMYRHASLTIELYTMLREAFRGGNTHANRLYSGMILENVKSADRVSSYPDVLCNNEFPVDEWVDVPPHKMDIEKRILRGKALLMQVAFTNIHLKDSSWGCPYLSIDKGRNIKGAVKDNGRILMAEKYTTTITDIDYKIIVSEYEWDSIEILCMKENKYGKLPREFINLIIKYFEQKTSLKGIDSEKLFYDLSKEKICACYGMCAQDPGKDMIEYINNEFKFSGATIESILDKYNKNVWLPYAWGVWVTAWARYRLEEGIRLAGDNFVYTDTDSVKYMGDIELEEYNNARIKDSKQSGAHATDRNGKIHYMGVYEYDGSYDKFITYGAKKYAYETNGKLGITISGVSKSKGAKELGKIENLKLGFIFREGGGLESVYNDSDYGDYIIDGHKIYISKNVCLRPSTYTLSVAEDYEMLTSRFNTDITYRREVYDILYTKFGNGGN